MQIKQRILSIVLVLVMLVSMIPMSVMAASDVVIGMDETWAAAGSSVDVNIFIKSNPGIIGGTLTVSWPEELTLVGDKNGTAFDGITYQKPSRYVNTGTNFVWYGSDVEEVKDGIILTLTFEVDENATDLDKYLITVTGKSFTDSNQNTVNVSFESQYVRIINYIPGDVSGDDEIAPLDLVLLARYISDGCVTDPQGYNVTLNESASDVNDDGELTPMDLILISRYISDDCVTDPNGYNVTLKPSTPKCQHAMTATPAVDATCTKDGNIAYWYCSECEKYFSEEEGKTEIVLDDAVVPAAHTVTYYEAKAATETATGCIAHWYCSACEKYFANSSATQELSKDDVIIPMLVREESTVVYNVYGSDPYLESVGVDNTINPSKFYSSDGLVLNDLIAPAGYVFKGWTTAAGAPVTEIAPSSSSRQVVLNATWSKVEYTVTFDSPDVPVESIKYTVDTGATFKNAEWYGYTFVGWSNNKGELLQNVKPGTTGNMTLHANWTSNRNRAKAVTELGKPIIIENMDDGQYLFVYEIGTIENVPLSVIEYIGNSQGITINKEYEYSKSVQEGFANTIAEAVSNATVKSSAWTLSEDWNSAASATNEHDEEIGKTDSVTDSQGNVVEGKYYISNVKGGETSVSSSSGGSNSTSSKVALGQSMGINGSYSSENSQSSSVEVGVDASLSGEVNTGLYKTSVEVSASAKDTETETNKQTSTIANSRESNIGTEKDKTNEYHWDKTQSESSSWNTAEGYEAGASTSKNTEVSNTISQTINDRYAYTSMEERGGSNSATHSTDESQELTNEYASTIEYSTEVSEKAKKTITYYSDATGYYRLVNAGTVHVFAVVGYDIATSSYFTYTYNVLDKERHEYLDYSKDNANFNDCENAVLPFEIPYFVNEFVDMKTARSSGLVVDTETGVITNYTGNAEYVLIPEYVSVDNADGTCSAVRICGIETDVFKGNTMVKAVSLPKYVTKIPNNAFEGCTSLKTIMGYGIMEIGTEAFKGCTDLETFAIDQYITSLGENAFLDVAEITVVAANEDVVTAALNSGAKKITLNLSKLDTPLTDQKLEVGSDTAYFALISDGSVYNNLQIVSHAEETFLSNFASVACKDTPLEISSEKLTLNRVIVQDAPGFALVLTSENTDVKLFGNNELFAKGDNAVLCKNVNLSLLNSSIASKMIVTGDVLCCGTVDGTSLLAINDGEVKEISSQEFEQYRSSIVVAFDANGGAEVTQENIVYYGQTYGELPVPTRDNHGFVGWFTEADGGTQIMSDSVVSALVNQTLYAHWAPNQFTLTYNANGGNVSTAAKSLTFGDSLGELPVPTKTHYSFDGWYTEADGGTKVTAETIPDSSDNITIYAHWTIIPYTASWNTGTGYTIAVNRTSSPNANASTGSLSSGATIYYGDTLSVTYIKQDYYTISKSGITSVTVTGNVDSSSIYASATLNPVSGWVKASSLPTGAQVTSRKYSYTQRTYKESRNTSESGWTQYDKYWVESGRGSSNYASFPGGFDTGNWIYTSFNKSAYSSYENTTNKRVVSNGWAGYVYWHWMYDCGGAGAGNRAIYNQVGYGPTNGFYYKYFGAFLSSSGYTAASGYCNNLGVTTYKGTGRTSYADSQGSHYWFRFDYYTSSYVDYYRMFKYYKDTSLESTTYPSGSNISNIVEWVQYRAK